MPRSKVKKSKIKSAGGRSSRTLGSEIKKVLVNYLTTQFILMVLVGFAAWGVLSLLKVGYAVPLAIITGILSGIPNFGMFLSTIIAAVVAVMDGINMWTDSPAWLEALIVLVVFFIFNKVIDLIIAPVFLGKTNKINPLVIIVVVTIGTIFFGIPGAVLAIPLYLVARTAFGHFGGGK